MGVFCQPPGSGAPPKAVVQREAANRFGQAFGWRVLSVSQLIVVGESRSRDGSSDRGIGSYAGLGFEERGLGVACCDLWLLMDLLQM